ncbi:MAG: PAS domain-containing protein, partial [Dehalococcoidia bacterium]|nr:PAS domain-containing protein [Dehalococcoidia bacterium]
VQGNSGGESPPDLDRLRRDYSDFDSLASQMFLSMFSNSPVGVYVVEDGMFSLTNLYFQQSTGYPHGELIG